MNQFPPTTILSTLDQVIFRYFPSPWLEGKWTFSILSVQINAIGNQNWLLGRQVSRVVKWDWRKNFHLMIEEKDALYSFYGIAKRHLSNAKKNSFRPMLNTFCYQKHLYFALIILWMWVLSGRQRTCWCRRQTFHSCNVLVSSVSWKNAECEEILYGLATCREFNR